ncbi:MAG: hypothetical protein AMXMBFR34_40140 [Myxococcaceae bacterium]
MGEHRYLVDGAIPVLKVHHEPRPAPAVVVLHGLDASAEVQLPELWRLADAGFSTVGVDAPHHGRRRDGDLRVLEGPGAHAQFLRLVREAIPEVSRVLTHLREDGHGPLAVLGISLGAYVALGVARADERVAATVSLLGSPDWSPPAREVSEELRALMRGAPVEDPDATARAPLLLVNAGLDTVVPPDAARAFAERLRGKRPVEYVEYPQSDHLMRPQDWEELWVRIPEFLQRHLR